MFTWLTISLTVIIMLLDIIVFGICSYMNYKNLKTKEVQFTSYCFDQFLFTIMTVYLFICVYILYVTLSAITNFYIVNFVEYYYSVFLILCISICLFFGLFNYYKLNKIFKF
jgi:hypothetical protein